MSTLSTSQACQYCGSTLHHTDACTREVSLPDASLVSLPTRCAQYPHCSLEKGHAGDCRKVTRAGLEGK
jgi:hypothetical protein